MVKGIHRNRDLTEKEEGILYSTYDGLGTHTYIRCKELIHRATSGTCEAMRSTCTSTYIQGDEVCNVHMVAVYERSGE